MQVTGENYFGDGKHLPRSVHYPREDPKHGGSLFEPKEFILLIGG